MLKRTPLVYMVSPMASTCNHYATKCTKTRTKILQPKNNEKEKNAPGKGQKGRNRVRFGCWGGVQPVRTGGKPEIRTKMHQIAMQHVQKENRQKPRVSAGFLAGAEGLGLGYRLGRFAAERHWRSLTPRHALRRAQPCLVAKSYRTLTKKVRYRRSDT